MKKIMIVKGEITGCDNYLVPECKLAVRYKVADTQHFHDCQKYVGHHFSLVYGDYGDQVAEAAEALAWKSCVRKKANSAASDKLERACHHWQALLFQS